MIKGANNQEYTILNVYAANNRVSKFFEAMNKITRRRQIYYLRDFDTLSLVIS